jgi:hypothetical protein
VGAEVDGHTRRLPHDDAAQTVLGVSDAIAHVELLDRTLRLREEGASGQVALWCGEVDRHPANCAPEEG